MLRVKTGNKDLTGRILNIARLMTPLLLVNVSGCSSAFMYNRIDSLAHMYIERYIELDSAQSHSLKADLESLKEWHRNDALADYLLVLAEIEGNLQQEITPATVTMWRGYADQAWSDLLGRAMPTVIEMAASLTPAQVRELAENMQERNDDRAKDYRRRDEEEYIEHIYEEMEERLSYWIGRLNSEQKQRLHSAADRFTRLDSAWLENRRAWQKEILKVLDKQPGWEDRLRQLLRDGIEYQLEEHKLADMENDKLVNAAVADVLNMRSERQSEKMARKINEWKENLRAFQAAAQGS